MGVQALDTFVSEWRLLGQDAHGISMVLGAAGLAASGVVTLAPPGASHRKLPMSARMSITRTYQHSLAPALTASQLCWAPFDWLRLAS